MNYYFYTGKVSATEIPQFYINDVCGIMKAKNVEVAFQKILKEFSGKKYKNLVLTSLNLVEKCK